VVNDVHLARNSPGLSPQNPSAASTRTEKCDTSHVLVCYISVGSGLSGDSRVNLDDYTVRAISRDLSEAR
jgi:hypothetical protein